MNMRRGLMTQNVMAQNMMQNSPPVRQSLLSRIGSTLGNVGRGVGGLLAAAGNAYAPPDLELTRSQQIGLLGNVIGDMGVRADGSRRNNTQDYLNNIRQTNELARRRQAMNSPEIQGLLSNVTDPAMSALLHEQVASGDVAGGMQNLFNYNQAQSAKRSLIDAARLSGLDEATLQTLEAFPDAAGIIQYLEDLETRNTEELTRRFDQGSDIRDDFVKETEDFRERQDKYLQIRNFAENPSAAGDIAMVFAYMKLLDPQSVVREGEYATAAQAGSIIDRATVGTYNRLIAGENLTPTQRAEFANAAKDLYTNALDGYFNTRDAAVSRAANFDLDFDRDVTTQDFQQISLDDLRNTKEYTADDFEDLAMDEADRQRIAKRMVDGQTGVAQAVQQALQTGDNLELVAQGFQTPAEAQAFLNTYFENARIAYPGMSFE